MICGQKLYEENFLHERSVDAYGKIAEQLEHAIKHTK
jgi:hypothetical protein